jgi:hypothetical protein
MLVEESQSVSLFKIANASSAGGTAATAKSPSIPTSIQCHLVTPPLHLRQSSTTYFPPYLFQQPTPPLMLNRTHDML